MADNKDEGSRLALGLNLKRAREYLGFSQDEVAEYLQIPRPSVTLMEQGDRKVSALELKALAVLYQRSLASFLGEETVVGLSPELVALAGGLPPEDQQELALFAEFLRGRRLRRKGSAL